MSKEEPKFLTEKEVAALIAKRMLTVSARTKLAVAQQVFQHQADAALSQANPVSETWYTVLDTTKNARLISISETPTYTGTDDANDKIEVKITIDGQTLTATLAGTTLASATVYSIVFNAGNANPIQVAATTREEYRAFLIEGRSVKVEARVIDGGVSDVTFTNLAARVKYAKIP